MITALNLPEVHPDVFAKRCRFFFPLETCLLEKRGKRPKRVGDFKENPVFVNGGGGKGGGKVQFCRMVLQKL